MQGFKVAAKRAEKKDNNEAEAEAEVEVIEIPFGERTLISTVPTPGQAALFYARLVGTNDEQETDNGTVNAVFGLLRAVLAAGDVPYLKELLGDDRISFGTLFGGDDDNEAGLVDSLLKEAAGRPTTPSSDSSPSEKSTGRQSTGRSPGKGSTRSASRSTDS